ncbi:MAG: S1C family serine protease [Candidatus Moranbacteria bacterium]|nr:S1C family serine protease [Candidatus Moranbacteria bacterium]
MQKTKKALIIIGIILISGLSGIIANRYVFPYLAVTKLFSKYDFLKKSTEDVTIINKTEQVYIKDDTSINKIVSQVTSSVVNITAYTTTEKTASGKVSAVAAQPAIKNGTGLIVASDGLIITYANTLIAENAKYKVTTSDGNIYDATLSEIDSYSNLAFLKINASNLSVAAFANSDDAKPGEKVIVVGNDSLAQEPSFAAGILSSFDPYYNLSEKTISSSEKLEGVFEIDIPAQTHYVGGPVVDYSGQIIGIMGAVSRDNKDSFFQIPSDKAELVIDKEIRKELGTNPTLGIYYIPVSKTYALVNNLPSETGALIYSPSGQQGLAIIANSPAATAGLKIGDILTAVSGEKIDAQKSLPDLLYKHKKGEEIELTILRNSQELKIKVQL